MLGTHLWIEETFAGLICLSVMNDEHDLEHHKRFTLINQLTNSILHAN